MTRQTIRIIAALCLLASTLAAQTTDDKDAPKTDTPKQDAPKTEPPKTEPPKKILILPDDGTTQTVPDDGTPKKSDEDLKRLGDLVKLGALDDPLIAAFKAYALQRAKESTGEAVPEDFWTWLETQKPVRDGLLVHLHPKYPAETVKALNELRTKYPKEVDRYGQLALAFAVVFGRPPDAPKWNPESSFRDMRGAPSMTESFDYYVSNAKTLKTPLDAWPWQLLTFIADNETPLPEREWLVKKYSRYTEKKLARIYDEVPYDRGVAAGTPRIGRNTRHIPNFIKYGGASIEPFFVASRTYKTLGIPAFIVIGEGKRGTNAWTSWLTPKGKSYVMSAEGRFYGNKPYTGETFYPAEMRVIHDRDAELLAAALAQGYDEYLNARIACHVFLLYPENYTANAEILKRGIERNPLCAEPWLLLAQACAIDVLPAEEGDRLLEKAFTVLGPHPDLTFEILTKVLEARLRPGVDIDEKNVARNFKRVEAAVALYEKADRPDLAVQLGLMKGNYLETLGKQMDALKLYMATAEKYAGKHYGFREAFDRAERMLAGKAGLRMRLAFCKDMEKKVERRREIDKLFHELNPDYIYVVRAYIRALQEAGDNRGADQWERRITQED